MPKRGDSVAPPPGPGEWDVRYGDTAAVDGWASLSRQAPGPTRAAWEALRRAPLARGVRQHPLRGSLGTRVIGGAIFEQWQLEVTGAGRIWYVVDETRRVVVLTMASVGHPKQTD